MTNTNIDMDAIIMWLDKGDIKKTAGDAGITDRQAQNIIKGNCKNYSFINRLVEKAEYNMRLAERTQQLRKNLKLIK